MKKNSRKGKNKFIVIISLIIILLLITVLFTYYFITIAPMYKIESRINNIENYVNENEKVKAVAWLRVQGTNIDYPVIDNNEELNTRMIEGNFTWTQGITSKLSNKIFILGHNVKNVSPTPLITDKNHDKFEQLLSFIYYDFVKDNKYIQYTIDGKDYLYKIFSVALVEDKNLDYISTNYDKKVMKNYIKQSLSDSYFDFEIEVNENDKIISLITCTRFYGATTKYMFKIDGRMVRENEFINNYKVNKNKNYEEIEKILRGESKNEIKQKV